MKTAEQHDDNRPVWACYEDRIKFYRHIQADALRWAAQLAIEKGERLFHAYILQANELDPLPKKPLPNPIPDGYGGI